MYVTSANISGEPACNNDQEVMAQLDGRIEYIVAGEAFSKTASTIIDCTGSELKVLRQGDLKIEDINKALL
jgi:L-threonylcarbamoyladenylate synthase